MESKQKQWLPTKLRYAIIWKMSPHFRDVKIGLDFQQLSQRSHLVNVTLHLKICGLRIKFQATTLEIGIPSFETDSVHLG